MDGVVKKEQEATAAEDSRAVELPGFRFCPTDEELLSFYLRRRLLPRRAHSDRALLALLIPDIDIYKYDPWDLPKMARLGEGSSGCYFFSPRGKKYRNSTRPNRVTLSGFWKATGTDRLVYSTSSTAECIGLKKSLVFYRGRASSGTKTDWMMHEFRLPSQRNLCENDTCWALCKIFERKSSNTQYVTETHDPIATEELPCSAGAILDEFEVMDNFEGDDCSEEDVKSEETTCMPLYPESMASVPIASSYHLQDKEATIVGPTESLELMTGGLSALVPTAPLTIRVSKSNGWADDIGSSWFSPTFMKIIGQPCLPLDGDLPCIDPPLQESFAPECLWPLFSPQINPFLPLWDQPAFF